MTDFSKFEAHLAEAVEMQRESERMAARALEACASAARRACRVKIGNHVRTSPQGAVYRVTAIDVAEVSMKPSFIFKGIATTGEAEGLSRVLMLDPETAELVPDPEPPGPAVQDAPTPA